MYIFINQPSINFYLHLDAIGNKINTQLKLSM